MFLAEVSVLTSRRVHAVVVALLLATAAACNGKQTWQFEGYVSRSGFWEYHDQFPEPICPTLLDLLDEHARVVGGRLGLTLDESRPFRYYRFAAERDRIPGCPAGVGGCAEGDTVLTTEPFDAHEQVHAYVSRAWGTEAVGLLTEGEAVALSCEPLYRPLAGQSPREALAARDWRYLLYLNGNSTSGYKAAGFWVTYLAQRFGWAKVEELHRRALPGLSAADFAIEFARVFPLSMDEAWAAALSGASPSCDSVWQCQSAPWSPGEMVQTACDGEWHRTIAVGAEPGIALVHRPPLLVRDCDDPLSPIRELVPGKYTTTSWAQLPPGRYVVFGEHMLSQWVGFVSYLPSPFLAADCTQAGTVTLVAGQNAMVELLPGSVDGCLRVDGHGQSYTVGLWDLELAAADSFVVCDSADVAATCISIPSPGSATVTIGRDTTLRLRGARSVPTASRSWAMIVFSPVAAVDGGT